MENNDKLETLTLGSGRDTWVSQALPRVVFVVTGRNSGALLERCLRSVVRQRYPSTRCVVVDDASDDGSADVIRRWAAMYPDLFTVYVAQCQQWKMANLWHAVHNLDEHDVVVELDADDRLLGNDVADDLARLHLRADLVWTQHRINRCSWPEWIHWRSTDLPIQYRTSSQIPRLEWCRSWHPSHLRSFKTWAFKAINIEDLKIGGEWVRAAVDVAYFCPLIESTPPSLRYFYDRESAVYNITARNNRFKDRLEIQRETAAELFSRPPYKTRKVPTWIGVLTARNERHVLNACAAGLVTDPALRIILGTIEKKLISWHPRIQIVRVPANLPLTNFPSGIERLQQDHDRSVLAFVLSLTSKLSTLENFRTPIKDLPIFELLI